MQTNLLVKRQLKARVVLDVASRLESRSLHLRELYTPISASGSWLKVCVAFQRVHLDGVLEGCIDCGSCQPARR